MTAGDSKTQFILTSLPNDSSINVDIQPSAGEVWKVFGIKAYNDTINANATAKIRMTDGTYFCPILEITSANAEVQQGCFALNDGADINGTNGIIIDENCFINIYFSKADTGSANNTYIIISAIQIK